MNQPHTDGEAVARTERDGVSTRRGASAAAWAAALLGGLLVTGAASAAPAGGAAAGGASGSIDIWGLFRQSFDLFTILLVVGSVVSCAIIVACVIEIRAKVILPPQSELSIRQLINAGAWKDLAAFVQQDDSFVSRVVRAALGTSGQDKEAMRETAELAASEECSRWFRKLEPLNVLGNLGPLLGLAGTVYGMVIAFAALGQSGGTPSPAVLSSGIAKALFHTLLGLLLAVPALLVFGFYRPRVDRLCNRGMIAASEVIEMLPGPSVIRAATAGGGSGGGAGGGAPRQANRPAGVAAPAAAPGAGTVPGGGNPGAR